MFESLERRQHLSAGQVWTIYGDTGRRGAGDVIRVEVDPADGSRARAVINHQVVSTRLLSGVKSIRVLGGNEADQVSIDLGKKGAGIRVRIVGGRGNDRLQVSGEEGAELIGGAGDDTLIGGEGKDLLVGGNGRDLLRGGDGDDTLHGCVGIDTLYGGNGTNVLQDGSGRDQLHDDTGENDLPERVVDIAAPDGEISTRTQPGIQNPDVFGPDRFPKFSDDQELRDWIVNAAVSQWKDLFGTQVPPYQTMPGMYYLNDLQAYGTVTNTVMAAGNSETNVQEQGVDEADIVETDGKYLYAAVGSQLLIVSAEPADQMAVVSRTDVGGQISGIYLSDGRVTVVTQGLNPNGGIMIARPIQITTGTLQVTSIVASDVVLSAPNFFYSGYENRDMVVTYDVSDAMAPREIERTTLDGRMVDSRMIDGRLYAVVETDMPQPMPATVNVGDQTFYESEESYRAELEQQLIDSPIGGYTSTGDGTSVTGSYIKGENVYRLNDDGYGRSLSTVVLIDPSTGPVGVDASATVDGAAGVIYANEESLYIAGSDANDWNQTDIAKFHLGTSSVDVEGVGAVVGAVKDQFSMGEYDGRLNIITTSWDGEANATNVFTLEDEGDRLKTVGQITGIAPGEQVFSSRLIGDRGYLVTFRRLDPLFTLDLSDPTNPKVDGELEMPGFSDYLQPLGGNFMLGMGPDADGHTSGLQISLFDVSDQGNPTRVASYQVTPDGTYSSSPGEYDHHAIQYFADAAMLAVPVSQWDSNTSQTVEGVALVKVDTSAGTLTDAGFIPLAGAERTIRIGGVVYAISAGGISAVDLADPGHLLGSVNFTT